MSRLSSEPGEAEIQSSTSLSLFCEVVKSLLAEIKCEIEHFQLLGERKVLKQKLIKVENLPVPHTPTLFPGPYCMCPRNRIKCKLATNVSIKVFVLENFVEIEAFVGKDQI